MFLRIGHRNRAWWPGCNLTVPKFLSFWLLAPKQRALVNPSCSMAPQTAKLSHKKSKDRRRARTIQDIDYKTIRSSKGNYPKTKHSSWVTFVWKKSEKRHFEIKEVAPEYIVSFRQLPNTHVSNFLKVEEINDHQHKLFVVFGQSRYH
jgi:hypothetical protein